VKRIIQGTIAATVAVNTYDLVENIVTEGYVEVAPAVAIGIGALSLLLCSSLVSTEIPVVTKAATNNTVEITAEI
jgi:hypothetical protein